MEATAGSGRKISERGGESRWQSRPALCTSVESICMMALTVVCCVAEMCCCAVVLDDGGSQAKLVPERGLPPELTCQLIKGWDA